MNQSWPNVGISRLEDALVAIRQCIKKEEDIERIKKMITEKSSTSNSPNEQALWETYKDFLDPRINDALRSIEGGNVD